VKVALVDTDLDTNIFRALGDGRPPAVTHYSSFEAVMQALSSMVGEMIEHARSREHGADVDLTIKYDDGAVRVGATPREHGPGDGRPMALTLMLTPLTHAELRVLGYLPTNLTLASIADECFVSRNTVKTQAISIYRKLGVSSRHDAVRVARELALLPPGS
jgi:DNA-binding NarL/FixJ family response regulator